MKEHVFKVGVVLALLSVFFLVLDCGPLCELDRSENLTSPCHQDPNDTSPEDRNCDWDSGSLNFAEYDSNHSKFQIVFLAVDFRFGTSARFFPIFAILESASFRFSISTSEYINIFSSVYLLI
ncbi:hypothetical protein EHQ12_10300 [Leptospira gomenensis]|uniref:Uncharacterized protein n=1 Tax=Leptospira gomenensis TaxID=2484974 RepID=A0A5F1YE48_9LEPT|nr:hypothetical protein [Leptospira gomenensis]TGK36415.1 hypothetical protein EHQ17_03865 [Leptospira gomenensis]TGK38244.1 hypothetical protein EHQ12_10300 [Leptospira gomenensis]TGK45985.1 hypothetical protein EHQ07_07425 [Leptospira gomenensis]TGK65249.1 hypothetical protein EHQ13_05230 [Leptospira gomenensis]